MGSPRFGMADTQSYLATHPPTEQSLKLQPHVHFHPIRGYSTFVILTIHCFSFPFSAHSMSLSTTIRAANTAAASITQVVTDLRVSGDNVATEWLGSEDDLRVELLLDSSVAGFIFLDPDSNFNAASLRCRSSQPDSWACNLSNDMTVVEPALIEKAELYTYVLVPVKKSTVQALNFQFHDHDLSTDYPSGSKFTWPTGFDQTMIPGTGIMVLAAFPCAIPYGYGATPPAGDFDTNIELITGMEGSDDFSAVTQIYKTLKANSFNSYHWTGPGDKIGAKGTDVFAITDRIAIAETVLIPYSQPRHSTPDHKKIRDAIMATSKALLDKWAESNDTNQLLTQHGLKHPPGNTAAAGGLAGFQAIPPPPAIAVPAKKLSMKANFSKCKYALVLATLSPNPAGTNAGEPFILADTLHRTFDAVITTPKDVTPGMVNAALKGFSIQQKKTMMPQYNDLTFNKLNKAILIKLGTSEWHMDPMNFDTGTAVSLGCFTPRSHDDNSLITRENDTSELETAIGQSDQHRTKIDTTVFKSHKIKDWRTAINTLIQLNAFLLFCADPQAPGGAPGSFRNIDKPLVCQSLERLILRMVCHDTNDWLISMGKPKHLGYAMCAKVHQALGRLWQASENLQLHEDLQNKVPIIWSKTGNGSAIVRAMESLQAIETNLENLIHQNDIGNFGTPPVKYAEHCEPAALKKRKKDEQAKRESPKKGRSPQIPGAGAPAAAPGITGIKLFVLNKDRVFPDFRKRRMPPLTIDGRSRVLCGRAHIVGINCTRPECGWAHVTSLDEIKCGLTQLAAYVEAESTVSWNPQFKAKCLKMAKEQVACKLETPAAAAGTPASASNDIVVLE